MNTPSFKTVLASVRPVRIAVLVDQRDEDWRLICLRVIEFLSTAWGGSYNIIIPTDCTGISETFWQVLEAFDPDYLFFYYKTGKDIKLDHPEKYQEWLENGLQSYLNSGDEVDVEYARKEIDEILSNHHSISELPETLHLQLKKRLAPFHIGNVTIEKGVGVGSKACSPLAPLINVLPNTEYPTNLLHHLPLFGGLYPLWLASITGLAGDSFNDIVSAQGLVPIEYNDYDPLEFVLKNGAGENWITPFGLANINLSLYRSKNASPYRGPVVVIVGDSVFDFCLYYALSRLRKSVIWMPQAWLRSEQGNLFDEFVRKLAGLEYSADTHPKFIFTSHSLNQTELESLLDELKRTRRNFFREAEIRFSLGKLLKHPLRLYEQDNVDMASSTIIRDGSYVDIFNTPKPKNFRKLDPFEHRWITEVHILNHQLPRHYSLGNWVVRHPAITANSARISSHGISFFCPNMMYFGGDIDTTLVRPTLFVPDAHQIFDYIFKKEGYQSAFSDKGIYAQKTLSKFGSLETLSSILCDDKYRRVFFKYLEKPKPEKGVHDEGCYLTDRRCYLNFPSIAKIIGSDEKSRGIIEALLRLGVLYRGYALKCGICKDAAWFGLEELSQTFKCKRCGSFQHITHENYWYGATEPGFYYKLDETVYQYLHHNGYISTLALEQLRRRCENNSFLFTYDLELINAGMATEQKKKELDILCICDGVLTLGEAKKENRLGKGGSDEVYEIRKYFSLAKEIGARALVFATFSEAWSPETLRNVSKEITDRAIEIITLTRQDLLKNEYQ